MDEWVWLQEKGKGKIQTTDLQLNKQDWLGNNISDSQLKITENN